MVQQRRTFQLEVAGQFATLYVVGPMGRSSRLVLLSGCNAVPESARVLTVSVENATHLGDGAMAVLRELRRHWMATRPDGAFRLGGIFSIPFHEPDPAPAAAA